MYRFFFGRSRQNTDSLGITETNRPRSGQNIGSKGLSRKILRYKGLAVGIVAAAFASEWFESGRMIRLCAFYILGQGCSSYAEDFFLCRAVENHGAGVSVVS